MNRNAGQSPSARDLGEPISPTSWPGRGEFEGVAAYYDELMSEVPYRAWVDYVEAILERRLARPRRVLDLCCGTGRVGAEMLARGYRAVGVDLSEPMARGCPRQRPPLPAAVQNACRLGIKCGSMDLVVSLFDSLNYVTRPEDLAQCFAEVLRVLAPRGLFVFDLNTPRALSTGLFNQGNLGSNDPLLYTWKAHWDRATSLCRVEMWFQWRGDGTVRELKETHFQYGYRTEEVLQMLANAGFSGITAYDAYTFLPPSRRSNRLYYTARKG